jgi:pseudouridine synthase
VLSAAGIGSRRACEAIIQEGKVMVNDITIRSLPAWVHPTRDRIEVDGRRIQGAVESVNVMLYKPRGVVCTNDDPDGRRRAIDLVQHPSRARLFTVGRLDIDSSGLLLMTNDGMLSQRIVHPSHNIEKVYEVLVRGSLSDESIRILLSGVFLVDREGDKPRRSRVKHIEIKMRDKHRTRFQVVLGEGRNRQIRRMTAALGHPVKRLKRLSIGPLKLRGLQPGQWRNLDRAELRQLRRAAHLPE